MKLLTLFQKRFRAYDGKATSSLEGKTTSQHQLYENYPISEHKDGYKRSNDPYSHDNCSQIWKDIVEINFSDEVEEIIIAKDFTYKIATNEPEATIFLIVYLYQGLRKIARYGAIKRKIKANGVGKFSEDNEELHFIDTFLEKYKEV